MSDSKHVTYEDAGVDTAEGGRAVDAIKQMVKETNRPEVIGGIGGFGGLFSAAALKDMEDPILISGTDGVGTKLVLAQIMDRHETVGQDLVAMCVNDILASGAEPLFFLDYVAIGHIEAEHMAKIIKGVADGCKLAAARSWAVRWPSTRASWLLPTTTLPDLPWASSTVPRCSTPRTSARAM